MESKRGGQEKDVSLPNNFSISMAFNPPSSFNKESSTKSPSAPPVAVADRRVIRNEPSRSTTQTLDQQQHHHNPPPPQQYIINNNNKDPDPDPDPVQAANATIPTASNSKTAPPQPQPAATGTSVRYRECLKNHAANMGGHVIDGCGEFMPGGEEGTPEALRCAACDCHRNFHRRESDDEPQAGTSGFHHARHNSTPQFFRAQVQTPLITMTHHHPHYHRSHGGLSPSPTGPTAPVMMAFGGSGGAAAESSSEDLNMFHYNAGGQTIHHSFSASKKRFRTKFNQQQKDRMSEFAEKLGWKIQKQDEQEVQRFCSEVGVKRQVFKVWMHNNKRKT